MVELACTCSCSGRCENRNVIIDNYNNDDITRAATLGNNNDERERLGHVAFDESGSMQIDSNPFG
jgi:hypothetical protein